MSNAFSGMMKIKPVKRNNSRAVISFGKVGIFISKFAITKFGLDKCMSCDMYQGNGKIGLQFYNDGSGGFDIKRKPTGPNGAGVIFHIGSARQIGFTELIPNRFELTEIEPMFLIADLGDLACKLPKRYKEENKGSQQ